MEKLLSSLQKIFLVFLFMINFYLKLILILLFVTLFYILLQG